MKRSSLSQVKPVGKKSSAAVKLDKALSMKANAEASGSDSNGNDNHDQRYKDILKILPDYLFADSSIPGSLFPKDCYNLFSNGSNADFEDFTMNFYAHSFNGEKATISVTQEFYGMVFNFGDDITYEAKDQERTIRKGQLGFMYIPQVPIEFNIAGDLSLISIQFLKTYLQKLAEPFPILEIILARKDNKLHEQINADIPGEVSDSLDEIFRQFRLKKPTGKFFEIIHQSLTRLTASYIPQGTGLIYDWLTILKARQELREHLKDDFDMAELEHKTGLNKDKIQQGYKSMLDTTVFDLLTKDRMKKAFELIIHTDYPVHKIAEQAGYTSRGLNGKFRDTYGITPGEIRNNVRR